MNDSQRGNLQDAINANVVNRKQFSEREMLWLFKGTCEAVRAMHNFRAPISTSKLSQSKASRSRRPRETPERHSDEDERFPHPEGDGDGGFSYGSAVNVPLVTKHPVEDEVDIIYDDNEELAQTEPPNGAATDATRAELAPYAHRDLKPG